MNHSICVLPTHPPNPFQIRTTSVPISALSAAAAAAVAGSSALTAGGGSPVSSPLRRRVSSATSFASAGILSLMNGSSPAASPSGLSILNNSTVPQSFRGGRHSRGHGSSGGDGSGAGSPAAGGNILRESNLSALRSTAAGDESLMGHLGRIHSAMPEPGKSLMGLGLYSSRVHLRR